MITKLSLLILRVVVYGAVVVVVVASNAVADPCVDSVQVRSYFDCTYSGSYRTGDPYDYVTITPNGTGEVFADAGISVEVIVKDCQGNPLVGVPADEFALWSPSLCFCPSPFRADAPTDENGRTTFSQVTLHGGGYARGLQVFVEGLFVGEVSVNVNSPANKVDLPWCFVDADAGAWFAGRFRSEVGDPYYGIGSDLNEDGFIDLTDLALFARALGQACPPGGSLNQTPAPVEAKPNRVRAIGHHAAAAAQSPHVGVFFDSLGTRRCAQLERGESIEYWILAFVNSVDFTGITGAELRLDDVPTGVRHYESVGGDMVFGSNVAHGTTIAWSLCQAAPGPIVVAHGWLVADEDVPPTTLRVVAATEPSNRHFDCPVLTRCEFPSACDPDPMNSSKVCAMGLESYINATGQEECTIAIESLTWGQMKRLYR